MGKKFMLTKRELMAGAVRCGIALPLMGSASFAVADSRVSTTFTLDKDDIPPKIDWRRVLKIVVDIIVIVLEATDNPIKPPDDFEPSDQFIEELRAFNKEYPGEIKKILESSIKSQLSALQGETVSGLSMKVSLVVSSSPAEFGIGIDLGKF